MYLDIVLVRLEELTEMCREKGIELADPLIPTFSGFIWKVSKLCPIDGERHKDRLGLYNVPYPDICGAGGRGNGVAKQRGSEEGSVGFVRDGLVPC